MTLKQGGDHAITRDSLYGTTSEPTYAGVVSFMRRKYTQELGGVDVVVTGVPLDTATTNRPGTRFGPRAIRAASSMIAWERPYGTDVDPLDKLAVIDYGDCLFDFGRPETVPDAIQEHAHNIISQGPALLSLGGDHFIAYPLLKAHAKKHGAPLSLLHFDAHSDTWPDEAGRVDHGTMFWHAAKEGLVDPQHSVQIGLRFVEEHWRPTDEDRCFIAPADLPGLTSTIINRLIDTKGDSSTVTIPKFGNRPGHPALLPWPVTQQIFDLADDQGVNQVVDTNPQYAVPFPADAYLPDVDTPQEYRSLLTEQKRSNNED